jgi:hypothetical protein
VTYESALRAELSFGDICEANFLYDVHVREDARAMGVEFASAKFAVKRWNIDQQVPYFIPGIGIKADQNYVLAHGVHQQAVVLSDDCLIATALGRDGAGPTSRRLLFAPIVDATADEVEELAGGNFGRFPLPADDHVADHRIADLRRCFMVDARAVDAALKAGGFQVRSLDDATRDDLAIRWAAYALRRGPFAAEDNLEKFAEYLLNTGRVEHEGAAVEVARALADVVAAAWGYEGRGVEGAGTAADDGRDPQEAVDRLIEELEQSRGTADAALAALRKL